MLEQLEARDGRASIAELMAATKLSESTVKRALRALVGAMLIERVSGGRHRGDVSQYRGASMPEEGGQEGGQKGVTVLGQNVSQGRGSNSQDSGVDVSLGRGSRKGVTEGGHSAGPRVREGLALEVQVLEVQPLVVQEPRFRSEENHFTSAPSPPDSLFGTLESDHLPPPTSTIANLILGEMIDGAREAGFPMSRRLISMFAKPIKEELDSGTSAEQVRGGITRMFARGQVRPALLTQFVLEAALPKPKPIANPSTMRYGRGMTPAQILAANPGSRELFDESLRNAGNR